MPGPVVATLHLAGHQHFTETVELLGRSIELEHIGCDGSLETMAAFTADLSGRVSAIALQGVSRTLSLGRERIEHDQAYLLFDRNEDIPIVDGSGVRAALERWSVRLAAEKIPGIWSRKRVLMVPGLNHIGLSQALSQYTEEMRYADPIIYFSLPSAPLIGRTETLEMAEGFTLSQLRSHPYDRLFQDAKNPRERRGKRSFEWADILAGDIGAIRRNASLDLRRKVIVVEAVSEEDVTDLASRGAMAIVTTMPPLGNGLARLNAATYEACLAAIREDVDAPLNENTYLNLMADLEWQPAFKYLQPGEAEINRFAFVIHPLQMDFIHSYRPFRWTKYLPDALVERVAAYVGPLYLSRITGIASPTTGQKVEGYLIALGATPKELMRRDPGFVYRRLIRASRMAERLGARIMGLGAFTSVVGDAGITVAQKADIAITSGNSLTVAATLEAAKQAVKKMGNNLDNSRDSHVMVIGATGSIGSVCSRLLAQAGPSITLVAPRPEKLIALKHTIENETPGARVTISTTADDYIGEADLIVTTTTALNTRILDIIKCKPGAVICDIARPQDISEADAALRPDVLVIESGEILLPGEPDYGYDIGLPPGVAYACLAETALLALEGRFEDYTLGRNIEIDRVKEIYRLFKKHQLRLSGLSSHGRFLTDPELIQKRQLAEELRQNPKLLDTFKSGAGRSMQLPQKPFTTKSSYAWLATGVGIVIFAVGAVILRRRREQ